MVLVCISLVAKEIGPLFMLNDYLKEFSEVPIQVICCFFFFFSVGMSVLEICRSYFPCTSLLLVIRVVNLFYSVGCVSLSALVCLGCCNKNTTDRWLRQQAVISQSWRLAVQGQGMGSVHGW